MVCSKKYTFLLVTYPKCDFLNIGHNNYFLEVKKLLLYLH